MHFAVHWYLFRGFIFGIRLGRIERRITIRRREARYSVLNHGKGEWQLKNVTLYKRAECLKTVN